jgi:hypothetical protein
MWMTQSPVTRYIIPLLALFAFCHSASGQSCTNPANAIMAENCLPGNPPTDWDLTAGTGTGDPTIQGFTTAISVNVGQTVVFKIQTSAVAYRLDIYRMGYYGGLGARKVASIQPSATLPQTQPPCLTDATTGLIDCGNWAVSASWQVPSNAVSGIYFARLVRIDTLGASHVFFVVRNDASTSALLFQTSDTTWQAYNAWGGNSLYQGGPGVNPGRAYKVSYNRPIFYPDRGVSDFSTSGVFNYEYPMVRWLEANGYDVTYSTGVDSDQNGSLILNHRVFLSVGHDEYWSGGQRANVEAARAAGVNLSFFSGNEIFWKTRWENSIDGTGTPYRTLVCYKETHADAKIDPTPTWTGTWRDPTFSPPSDGGRPENELSGTIFMVNGPAANSIAVPAAYANLRFWRNTSVATLAPGTVATFATRSLGREWDEDLDNGSRPPGLIDLSSMTTAVNTLLLDYGNTYGPGTATHSLTLYRHPSGALVFGAGDIEYSWNLDANHWNANPQSSPIPPADPRLQQATVNLLSDMGVAPGSIQPGLLPATTSTDTIPPISTITYPANGSILTPNDPVLISGTATDVSGVVANLEVSTDGGATWHRAQGTANWTYTWVPTAWGSATIESRATDDSGNLEVPSSKVTVVISGGSGPFSIWPSTATPGVTSSPDGSAVEVGVKFRSDAAGYITGIRFYKGALNTGVHTGQLWTTAGTLLAQGVFSGETASGWQQLNFSAPVAILANTVYIAAYHTTSGHYSYDLNYFSTSGVDNPPLHALENGLAGPNGIYVYSATPSFPQNTYNSTNYSVDVVFSTTLNSQTCPCTIWSSNAVPSVADNGPDSPVELGVKFTSSSNGQITGIRFYKSGANTGTHVGNLWSSAGALLASATFTNETGSGWQQVTFSSPVAIAANTTYVASYHSTVGHYSADQNFFASNGINSPPLQALASGINGGDGVYAYGSTSVFPSNSYRATNYWVDVVFGPPAACPCSIWSSNAVPSVTDNGPDSPVELGVKFTASRNGQINGIRFYKSGANTGTHVGNLWSSAGALLASATFTNETGSGWQQVTFSSPVAITANTTYVASYHSTVGHYSADQNFFANSGINSPPLQALGSGISGGDGVYMYGSASNFPNMTYAASNYWVDVVFQ